MENCDVKTSILADVQTSIWTFYANRARKMDELGHRKLILSDVIQMVEGLPVFENHVEKDFNCEICCCSEDEEEDRDLPFCHLPCDECITFHRVCLRTEFKYIASINYQACELKNEITKQKMIYEADRDNRTDDFVFQLYMSVRVLESLWQKFRRHENTVHRCTCDNPSSECITYLDPLAKVAHIIREIIDLIEECVSDGFLKEREERELERQIM